MDTWIPKYGYMLCYTHTGSFIAHIKTEDIYTGIAKGFKATIDTLNHKLAKPLRKEKNKKNIIGLLKDELGNNERVFSIKTKKYTAIQHIIVTKKKEKKKAQKSAS